jgi:signal transduction histidine kinase
MFAVYMVKGDSPMSTGPDDLPGDLGAATLIAQLRRENERLTQRTSQLEGHVRSLEVLQEIANTLSGELHLPNLLRRIAIAALRLAAGHASIVYLVDPSVPALVARAVETELTAADSGVFFGPGGADQSQPGLDGETDPTGTITIGWSEGVAGYCATSGERILIDDPRSDTRFTAATLAVDGRVLGFTPSALVAVPMIFKGVVTGVLEVAQNTSGQGFDAQSLDLLRTLAAQAATAVANAQLYRRLRIERDRIIQAQEDERKRLGRELHDGPAQKVAQIAISLEYAEQLAKHEPDRVIPELRAIRDTALGTSREIRDLLFDLRPLVLEAENGGLVAALNHFLARFQAGPGPKLHLRADYAERLSHNQELTVFAIVQEAVNNVLKHAGAQNCWIDIREYPEKLVVIIRDDGAGFDVKQVQDDYQSRGSWGLLNMLERAELIDAKLNIASQPGKGTITSLEVPREPAAVR